jgi:hypothetical protein
LTPPAQKDNHLPLPDIADEHDVKLNPEKIARIRDVKGSSRTQMYDKLP